MYEESSMDKKQSSRSGQPPSKGFGAESKKSQDVTGKPWPRGGGRRREPAGGTFSAKPEPSRKPWPQRNKAALDKRPKPRGNYYGPGVVGGNEDARLTENAELGSVFLQGSKKQSLNHLLNFHYAPRQGGAGYDGSNISHRSSQGSHRWLQSHKHKYNKEQFLQANCQFVVTSRGNYEMYMKDPDALVDWDLIEQVHIQVSEFPSCPICLYPPVAAKMTRCGHIYCWSCVLHYLALSDKSWRCCPICFEAVHKQDLKSVMVKPFTAFTVGDVITMGLMRRERGSLRAIPIDEITRRTDQTILNVSEVEANTSYSKLLLADFNEIMTIVHREHDELSKQLSEDENCPEKCFIEQALELLTLREKGILNTQEQKAAVNKQNKIETTAIEAVRSEQDPLYPNSELARKSPPVEYSCSPSTKETITARPSKFFYFYQATDGQHIFLHPLNIKMLELMYGTLEQCPSTIVGNIVEKHAQSMTEELRNKQRYLQHLPVTCQYEVAELQMKPPIITKEILDCFKDDLDRRRKQRQRRARDERKHEKRILEKENRLMGRYPTPHIHIDSHYQFPNFSETLEVTGSPPTSIISSSERSVSPSERSPDSSTSDLISITENLTLEEHPHCYSGPSFATMLSKSKERSSAWPTVQQGPQPSAPVKLIAVTGGNHRTGFEVKRRQVVHEPEEDEPEGYVPAPTYHQSFSDAIALALEQSANQACNDDDIVANPEPGKKKKKKQNRKILFATSMAYAGK